MKSIRAIVLVSLLGAAAGCSTSGAPEPGPGAPEKTTVLTSPRALGRLPSDVVATKLYARPALDVARRFVQVSSALPISEMLMHDLDPVETAHTDILHIAPKGLAGVYKVPIDTTDGEAHLFLSPQINQTGPEGHDAIQGALRNVEVYDPLGVRVNVRAPKNNTQADMAMSAIPLAGHPAGVYTVKFTSGAPEVGLAIEARLATSAIVLKLKPSTTQHLLGNEAFVDATLMDGATPIVGAKVTADLVHGESLESVTPVTFTEIGGGVYRATLTSSLSDAHRTGAYLADVRAEGSAPSGARFFRHGRTGFHFGVPTAKILDIGAQRTITDASGKIVAFEVDVKMQSASLDRLELSGKLTFVGSDGQEHPIAIAHAGDAFDAGTHTVTLRFDAGQLRLTGAEGTFYVRDVRMFSLGTNTLFHREMAAKNLAFPNVARAMLRPAASLSSAEQHLVEQGIFRAD